jgi:uncharacterized iron-regulated membrane protein
VGSSWAQALFAVAACLPTMGGLAGLVLYKRRRRSERGEKAPQLEKILRPPGYSASLQLDEATNE